MEDDRDQAANPCCAGGCQCDGDGGGAAGAGDQAGDQRPTAPDGQRHPAGPDDAAAAPSPTAALIVAIVAAIQQSKAQATKGWRR